MVFITADLKLNDKDEATSNGLTTGEYNDMIIRKWNEVVKPEDTVVVIGVCGTRNFTTIKAIMEQLNGVKILADYRSNDTQKKSMWKWVGFKNVWTMDLKYDTQICGEDSVLYISNNEKKVLKDNEYMCVGTKLLADDIFDGKRFNISMKNWDFAPIGLNTVIEIINNYGK